MVTPDEFLKLLKDFVLLSKNQLTQDECDVAKKLIDQIADSAKAEQFSNRCLVVATGFLLQVFLDEVISTPKKGEKTNLVEMKFKETLQ